MRVYVLQCISVVCLSYFYGASVYFYGFCVLLWNSYGIPMYFYSIAIVFLCTSMVLLWYFYGTPMYLYCVSKFSEHFCCISVVFLL